jgi:hypothetical protein
MWSVGAFLALILAVIGHASLRGVPLPLDVVARFLLTGGIIGAGLVWWLVSRYGVSATQTWAGAMVYAACCELYIFLFTFAMTSITANLIGKLSRRDLTETDIEELYDSRDMVASRLDHLIAIGLVVERPTGLQLTTKGARMVRIFYQLRGLFRHPQLTYNFPTNH